MRQSFLVFAGAPVQELHTRAMPRFVLTAAHRLGKEEAQRRLKEKLSAAFGRYGSRAKDLHEEWRDHSLSFGFTTMGMKVAGTLAVDDTEVCLTAQVPYGVLVFRSLIEKRIRAELGNLLA